VTALAARRRHPLAKVVLVLLGLVVTGLAYSAAAPGRADAAEGSTQDIAAGRLLFLANCASCHGLNAEGRTSAPSLVGVGAAAVDFQVGTGRMPLQASGPQAPASTVKFQPGSDRLRQLAAYIGSLGPGPAVPSEADYDPAQGNPGEGALIFRTNCAMCHNIEGKGGALTRGKYAPDLSNTSPEHIYEAMLTGPQSMPPFKDQTVSPPQKRDVIAYLQAINNVPAPGGLTLGGIGPVSEGLVAWLVGLTLLVGCAVWLGSKSS
jgi:ubiquinol-cytochrome c reductase cytochrome c subunit